MNAPAMTDLLERLYAVPETGADPELIEAAAKEIERLRAENERLRAEVETMERQKPVGAVRLCERCKTPFDGEIYCPTCNHYAATEETVYLAPGAQPAPNVPDGVVEARQRLIENGAFLGPASAEDALLVARYRQYLLAGAQSVPSVPVERTAFESWARNRWTHPEDFDQRIGAPNKYNNYEVQAAWDAWQKRAAQTAPSVQESNDERT